MVKVTLMKNFLWLLWIAPLYKETKRPGPDVEQQMVMLVFVYLMITSGDPAASHYSVPASYKDLSIKLHNLEAG